MTRSGVNPQRMARNCAPMTNRVTKASPHAKLRRKPPMMASVGAWSAATWKMSCDSSASSQITR